MDVGSEVVLAGWAGGKVGEDVVVEVYFAECIGCEECLDITTWVGVCV